MVDQGKESCAYTCSKSGKGWYPTPTIGHKPTSNGWYAIYFLFSKLVHLMFPFTCCLYSFCSGAEGGGWLATTVRKTLNAVPRSWRQCCNKHDICYGTWYVVHSVIL
jgi:hypothetical protein